MNYTYSGPVVDCIIVNFSLQRREFCKTRITYIAINRQPHKTEKEGKEKELKSGFEFEL